MPIYVPKQIVPLTPTRESPLFFLAGPVRGGGDWQAQMADRILDREPEALITCPSRWKGDHRLASRFYQPFSPSDTRQLIWERHYLKQSGVEPKVPGCVIFWLGLESNVEPHPGPEPYAMDSRREIGKFTAYLEVLSWFPELAEKMDVRVVVGGSRRFHGLDVILFELGEAIGEPLHFHENMKAIVESALLVARQ